MGSAVPRLAAPLISGLALGALYWGVGGIPALAGAAAVGVLSASHLAASGRRAEGATEAPKPAGLALLSRRIHAASTRQAAAAEIAAAAAEIARAKVVVRAARGWADNRGEPVPDLTDEVKETLATGQSHWLEDGGVPLSLAGWMSEQSANGVLPLIEGGAAVGVVLVTEPNVVGQRRAWLEECARVAESNLKLRELQESAAAGQAASVELDLAAALQQRLVPGAAAMEVGGYELSAYYEPATHCAGDWWAIYNLGSRLVVVIGDVTGHGLASAMVSAAAKGASDAYCSAVKDLDVAELTRLLDATVREVGRGQFFMTFFAASLSTRDRSIEFANAGHVTPYIVRADGSRLDLMLARGNPLGAGSEPSIGRGSVSVNKGDKLVWYTDGLTERLNNRGELFGDRRLQRLLQRAHALPSASALEGSILEAVDDFAAGADPDDDITLVIGRVT